MRTLFSVFIGLTSTLSFASSPVFRQVEDAVFPGNVRIAQAEATLSGGVCRVLLDKPRQNEPIPLERLELILGRSGQIISHPDSNNPAVNCHSFAFSFLGIELPKNAWLEPDKSYLALLTEYFTDTKIKFDKTTSSDFGNHDSVQDGDLVLLAGFGRLNHTGVVITKNGYHWILSKLDEEAVVLTRLENLMEPYFSDLVKVYRKK